MKLEQLKAHLKYNLLNVIKSVAKELKDSRKKTSILNIYKNTKFAYLLNAFCH